MINTKARFKRAVFGAMRRVFSQSSIAKNVRSRARHPTERGPRGGECFICSSCLKTFGCGKTNVDHIDPVIPVGDSIESMSLDTIFNRLFCDESNLQLLCEECHNRKSAEENSRRKEIRECSDKINMYNMYNSVKDKYDIANYDEDSGMCQVVIGTRKSGKPIVKKINIKKLVNNDVL